MKSDPSMDRLLRNAHERPRPASAGDCLDAETAAAWADRSLGARERAAVEAHAAQCARCQSLLAMIIRTGDVMADGPPRRAVGVLQWLLPLTAAAAAVALWIAVPDRPVPSPSSAPVAKDTAPAPSIGTPPPVAERDARADTAAAAQRPQAERRAPAASERGAAPPAAPPLQADRAQELPTLNESVRLRESERRAESAADARTRAGAAPAHDKLTQTADAPAPEAAPKKAEPAGSVSGFAALMKPQMQWRVAAGSLDRSSDGGRTWQRQATGIEGAIAAMAAPAPSVCWVVGRGGAVARTVDGVSWHRIPFPDPTRELVNVQATDDRTAIVTASDGARFQTSDAGNTWTLLPPQEFPPAPF